MQVLRRRVLQCATTAAVLGVAGCSTLDEDAQFLVIENETESTHEVEIVVNQAAEGTGTATTATDGTSTRFVVDFTFEVGAGSEKREPEILPAEGDFEVIASASGLESGHGSYSDGESVRVTLADGGIDVTAFTPSS